MSGSADSIVERYESFLAARECFGEGFCWTVLVSPAAEVEVLDALAPEAVENLGNASFDKAGGLSADVPAEAALSTAWLTRGRGWAGVLEFDGYAGTLAHTLESLSRVADLVVGVFWLEAQARCRVVWAKDGVIEIVQELDDPEMIDFDSAPNLSDALQAALSSESEDVRAVGLATVELATGVVLGEDLIAQSWPLLRFPVRSPSEPASERERPDGNSLVQIGETDLFDALDDATPARRLAARSTLIQTVLAATELADDPVVRAVADPLARNQPPSPPPELYDLLNRLDSAYKVTRKGFSDEAAWRRSRAVGMLFGFCGSYAEPPADPRDWNLSHYNRYFGWHQATLALGDDWPSARTVALSRLRNP